MTKSEKMIAKNKKLKEKAMKEFEEGKFQNFPVHSDYSDLTREEYLRSTAKQLLLPMRKGWENTVDMQTDCRYSGCPTLITTCDGLTDRSMMLTMGDARIVKELLNKLMMEQCVDLYLKTKDFKHKGE